jgi:precorrin-6B methylase 1
LQPAIGSFQLIFLIQIADNLSKAGWSWGWVSAIDSHGRTIWIADAHRNDGRRFIVHSDELLTAFLELESAYPHLRQIGFTG